MTTLQERMNEPDFLVPENDDELWLWAMHVGKALHPVYAANDWRWSIHGREHYRDDAKEVPSAERIAATLYDLAKRVLEDGGAESTSTGRLTVFRSKVEYTDKVTVGAHLDLPDLYDALLAVPSSSEDGS